MLTTTLNIAGMSCGHCLNAVSEALHSLEGVQVDSVQMGRAVVSYDESIVTTEAIERAISDAGYAATAA